MHIAVRNTALTGGYLYLIVTYKLLIVTYKIFIVTYKLCPLGPAIGSKLGQFSRFLCDLED